MNKRTVKLTDIAGVVRSKNAGPYELTLDILFNTEDDYRAVRDAGVFTRERVAELYSVRVGDVRDIVFFEPALALKIVLVRERPSGAIGDSDIYGAQQHGPLIDLELELRS